jgi:large subunit ribosomal protein L3
MHVSEFRTEAAAEYKEGELLDVASFFEAGEKVDVIANSKGKGFQGVVKRYGFSGQPDSHGSMSHRRPGSIGHCQWPGEVKKGQRMPGRMGNERRTVQNLIIVRVMGDQNVILIKGSVPGPKGAVVRVRKAVKGR